MNLTIVNITGSTKTYLSGAISVSGNSSTNVTNIVYQFSLSTDGQLRSDLQNAFVQLTDGVNTYGADDALDYLKYVAFIVGPISNASGNLYFHPVFTTRVQSVTAANSSSSTTLTANIGATQSGNLIVVTCSSHAGTLTITDSASQTYSTASTINTGGGAPSYLYTFYVANTTAGVTSVTITDGSSTALNMIVTEYANALTSSPLDKTSTNTNTATTSWTSNATTTTAQASELLIGAALATLHSTTTFTSGTGYVAVGSISNTGAGINQVNFQEEQYVNATSTYSATGLTSASDTELASIATFKMGTLPTGFTYLNAATLIKSGPGYLVKIIVNTAGTGSTKVTLYDNTTNSGIIIAVLSLSTVGVFEYNLKFNNGLTMVVNSSTSDFTLVYD